MSMFSKWIQQKEKIKRRIVVSGFQAIFNSGREEGVVNFLCPLLFLRNGPEEIVYSVSLQFVCRKQKQKNKKTKTKQNKKKTYQNKTKQKHI